MDIQIGEMNTTVRAMDSQALLNPQVMEQIIRAALQQMRQERDHDTRVQRERQLDPGVSEPETIPSQP